MCGLDLGFHAVIMQHPDVPKMLCWRERDIKTDIRTVNPVMVAGDELHQMFLSRPQAATHRWPRCHAQRLGDNLFSQLNSPSSLGQSPDLWGAGKVECSRRTWALTRGSGDTFRNRQCHNWLESCCFWGLSPVALPSADGCFPCCLATITNYDPGLNPGSWHPLLLIFVRNFFF